MATDGDIRVLIAIDLVLSAVFSTLVVRGLSLVGSLAFSWLTVGFATLLLALVTYLAVLR
ncbi:hypothetical protein [Halococcus hamelinensis]|uniref:DUF8107 domain-containing protein n=1 Tax=Halococcus hamelinensis 100A6 TaxID=1132509 RepID=M0M728_9EURY|nr:hypothetical protein [Halococcus hamelinensis]EMA40185.1 hypothetical protein C447_04617 [Halococcus hamelinensis 100A6]